MADKRNSHRARYSSVPTVNVAALEIPIHGDKDEKLNTIHSPLETNDDTIAQLPHENIRKRQLHKKSSSLDIHHLADRLGLQVPDSDDEYHHSGHTYQLSANMLANLNNGIYNQKEQQDLISIQSNLHKWIGSEKYLILDEFIDLMGKIVPHISAQEVTSLFNQMDPSNNGQVPTALLLHDEFLPRMILNLFQRQDDDIRSVTGRDSVTSVEEYDLDSDSDNDAYANMDAKDLIRTIKAQKSETKQLKNWIIEIGQPALAQVDELQEAINIYESEARDKQYELQSFQQRIGRMAELQKRLQQTVSHTNLIMQHNDNLMLSVDENNKLNEIQRKKFEDAVREAAEYKKLSEELQDINDKYNHKNNTLLEKQNKLAEENQSLRQLVLQYETEYNSRQAEYDAYDEYMQNYAPESPRQGFYSGQKSPGDGDSTVQWDQGYGGSDRGSFAVKKKRRMTHVMDSSDTFDEKQGFSLESELGSKANGRRNTIRNFYDIHSRVESHMGSLPTEEQLLYDEQALDSHSPHFERQDSAKSFMSTYDRNNNQTPAAMWRTQKNIFEATYAHEISVEIREKIEKEVKEDYELKLKQRDIELRQKLNTEKTRLEEEHRRKREEFERRMDEIKGKLVEYRQNNKGRELVSLTENLSFDADEFVDVSSEMSEFSDNNMSDSDDDGKEVFEFNYNYENDIERPLSDVSEKSDKDKRESERYISNVLSVDLNERFKKKKRKKRNKKRKEIVHTRSASDGKCFSCWGLFTGQSQNDEMIPL